MRTSLSAPHLEVGCNGDRVASYRTVRAASLALRRLEDAGFPADLVRVQPRGLSPLDAALLDPPPRSRRVRTVVVVGVVAVAVVAWRELSAATIAAALAASVLAGLLFLTADGAYSRTLARRVRRAGNLVRAERFDIVCSRRAAEANHTLATWWHPDAPPASRNGERLPAEPRRLARAA